MTRGGWEEWYASVKFENGSVWEDSVVHMASLMDRDGFRAKVCIHRTQDALLWARRDDELL